MSNGLSQDLQHRHSCSAFRCIIFVSPYSTRYVLKQDIRQIRQILGATLTLRLPSFFATSATKGGGYNPIDLAFGLSYRVIQRLIHSIVF